MQDSPLEASEVGMALEQITFSNAMEIYQYSDNPYPRADIGRY